MMLLFQPGEIEKLFGCNYDEIMKLYWSKINENLDLKLQDFLQFHVDLNHPLFSPPRSLGCINKNVVLDKVMGMERTSLKVALLFYCTGMFIMFKWD